MSKLSLNYTLSDGRVIEIPAADLRPLRDDLNELLPPGHDRYEQSPMPFRPQPLVDLPQEPLLNGGILSDPPTPPQSEEPPA